MRKRRGHGAVNWNKIEKNDWKQTNNQESHDSIQYVRIYWFYMDTWVALQVDVVIFAQSNDLNSCVLVQKSMPIKIYVSIVST